MSSLDHRLVLDNPHFGWPSDVWAEAEEARDAELRALRPDNPVPAIAAANTHDRTMLRPMAPAPIRRPGWGHPVMVLAVYGPAFLIALGAILLWRWLS